MMTLTLDTRKVMAKITKLQGGLKNFSPFLNEVETKMTQNITKNFDTEGRFLEQNWAKRIQAGSWPLLNKTGRLKNSNYRKERTEKRIVISNKASYYPYHQLGTSKMTKRIIMTWTNGTKNEIQKMFQIYINKLLA